jgi:hypothetical protein
MRYAWLTYKVVGEAWLLRDGNPKEFVTLGWGCFRIAGQGVRSTSLRQQNVRIKPG